MSILVALSILVRILNFCWSIVLVRRVRDWRLAFLPPMMILTVLRQTIDLFEDGVSWQVSWSMPLSEVPGLLLSGITFLLIFVLDRIFKEREQVRVALAASLAKYYTVFRSSPDAIAIISRETSRIHEVNDGFQQLLGIGREEAVGRTSLDLDIWEDEDVRQRAIEHIERDGQVRDFEARLNTRSGDTVTCQLSAEVIELEGELCTLMVMRDITQSQQAKKEREAFVEQLEAKNAELERFTYTVSHDLKSPLVTIRGFVGLLKKDLLSGRQERVERDVEKIDGAAATMGQLLDEVLELSRIGRVTNPPVEVSVVELARQAAELVDGRIDERGLEMQIDPELPIVIGDRPRLLEVFQNLFENAIKFMGEQPKPRIEAGVAPGEGDDVVFYVRDNGKGVSPRYHDKIFGLFERLDHSIEGTGIGLALVKRIVEVHGGSIWIESEGEGKGSTFFLTLPGVEADVEASTTADATFDRLA